MSKLKYFNGTSWVEVNGQITGDTLPIGSIMPYGSTTAPTNWLVCDGSAVSRTTYSELFSVIGTSFGEGDGSTTFNLPNLKGKVPVGQDTSDSDFNDIGETGGSKELQEHRHTIVASTILANPGSGGTGTYVGAGTTNTSTAGTGNSGNLQPYQVVCYIIKAKQSSGLVANVSNTYSTSENDTYSCEYVNGIIESGANANGYYTKYADGTLICRYYVGSLTTNAYSSATLSVTFPSTFLNNEYSCCISFLDPQAYWGSVNVGCRNKTTTGFTLETWNSSEGQNPNQWFNYIAIGRWK